MRRIWATPRTKFAFPLVTCFIISACSLPPKPRFSNTPVAPESAPREIEREQQNPAPSASIILKNVGTKPSAAVFNVTPRKNGDELLLSALGPFLNAPYALGGETPDGVDCSGLVKTVFADAYGFNVPHNAAAQFRLGANVMESHLHFGDLVFFETRSRRGRYVSHVGIYLSNRRFVHAGTKAGVIVSDLDEAYWRRRYAGARRLIDRR